MNVLVVTPTYNERENLPLLAAGVLQHDGFRLLVVDDGSPDGTGAIADRLAAAHPGEVAVLHRDRREGLGPAYLAGFARALDGGAAFVFEMDADGSHDPEDLARLPLGMSDGIVVDVIRAPVRTGDAYLLLTHALWSALTPRAVASALAERGTGAAPYLVAAAARERGRPSADDLLVVVVVMA